MTKPKHRYSKFFFGLVIPFFSLAFLKSSFFKIKEIRYDCLNFYLEKETSPFLEKIKEKNLIFLNSNYIKSNFEELPFLEVESFQKILPNKLLIKFKMKEELATVISNYGSFDLYEGGSIFPRFKKTEEKFIVEGSLSKEDLKIISEILKENQFIYENFSGIKISENGTLKFLNKEGYWIEILKDKNLKNLKEALKVLEECPSIFKKEEISMINVNLFIASR